LVISDSEIDAYPRDDESHTYERPPESAVATIDKVGEAADDHPKSCDNEGKVLAEGGDD
jgi:hypothetical protein